MRRQMKADTPKRGRRVRVCTVVTVIVFNQQQQTPQAVAVRASARFKLNQSSRSIVKLKHKQILKQSNTVAKQHQATNAEQMVGWSVCGSVGSTAAHRVIGMAGIIYSVDPTPSIKIPTDMKPLSVCSSKMKRFEIL